MELRTLTDLAVYPEAAAMHLDEVFGDGQTQACTSRFTGAGHIDALEALKDARLVGLRNADPRVRDGKDDFFFRGFCADDDLAARQSVLDGVVQQVLQNFGKPPAIAGYVRQVLRQV